MLFIELLENLHKYLNSKDHSSLEGNCSQIMQQMNHLFGITLSYGNNSPIHILEIGFNAGHSALTFLQNPMAHVTSIDIGAHYYVLDGKTFIDTLYPGRHTLVIGDSRHVLPSIQNTYDIIFIDGAHDYETVKKDLETCLKMCHKDTIIIMDDVIPLSMEVYDWAVGPSRVWWEARSNNLVDQMGRSQYGNGRGMVWGKKLNGVQGAP
jgi:predicted O-methyltransferase YrrM